MLFRYLQLTFAVFQIDVDEANELESIGTVLVFVSWVEGYLACCWLLFCFMCKFQSLLYDVFPEIIICI